MWFLPVLLIMALVAGVSYMANVGRGRKRRPQPVPRPGAGRHRRDRDADLMMAYAVADAVADDDTRLAAEHHDGPGCDEAPLDGDAGEDAGDCNPGADSDSADGGDSDSGGSDSSGPD
ncbi:MAG: hypothetical protein JWN15_2545 [Firmicutes bacterium]|nr:hypothetical protein [Bacillota bacterium]